MYICTRTKNGMGSSQSTYACQAFVQTVQTNIDLPSKAPSSFPLQYSPEFLFKQPPTFPSPSRRSKTLHAPKTTPPTPLPRSPPTKHLPPASRRESSLSVRLPLLHAPSSSQSSLKYSNPLIIGQTSHSPSSAHRTHLQPGHPSSRPSGSTSSISRTIYTMHTACMH